MISGFFGVPGCGKTTILTKIAQKELKRIKRGKSKYKHVYTNFECSGCKKISYEDLANYKVYDSLLLFDELTLDADNRKFKEFSDSHRDFFILHRHFGIDLIYATQCYDKIDTKIQSLTQDLWYMTKSVLPFFNRFSRCVRIYRNIAINEHTSELKYGYRFCNLAERFFSSNVKLCYRPFYYKYFNSYEEGSVGDRPLLVSDTYPVYKRDFSFTKKLKSKLFNFVGNPRRLRRILFLGKNVK